MLPSLRAECLRAPGTLTLATRWVEEGRCAWTEVVRGARGVQTSGGKGASQPRSLALGVYAVPHLVWRRMERKRRQASVRAQGAYQQGSGAGGAVVGKGEKVGYRRARARVR